jgi:hypothetical protein
MRTQIGLAVVALAFGLAGCCSDCCKDCGLRSLISDSKKPGEVATPQLAAASVEASKRVHKIGSQLLAGNTAMGLEITFQTVGNFSEPEIFHPDSHGVFITESLVNLCKTDDQLAAVLATELGQMVSEQRNRERMRMVEPIPTIAGGPKLDGSTDYDPGRDMELARYEKDRRKPTETSTGQTANPKTISENILKDSKIDPGCLTSVSPMLKEAKRNHALAKQFGGKTDEPHWSN